MYRYEAATNTFKEFQVVPTSDVVCPATFHVGTSLYLLLLSEEEHLDVYKYIPLEVCEEGREGGKEGFG